MHLKPNLTDFCINQHCSKYELYGFTAHIGVDGAGHFTTLLQSLFEVMVLLAIFGFFADYFCRLMFNDSAVAQVHPRVDCMSKRSLIYMIAVSDDLK